MLTIFQQPANRFYLAIGVLELLGAIGLLIPRAAEYAASGLNVLMIGAALTHLTNGEGLQVMRPIIFMMFLSLIGEEMAFRGYVMNRVEKSLTPLGG